MSSPDAPLVPDITQALSQIQAIRRQVAHSTTFHGYGPLTLNATAVLAILTGIAQSHMIPNPSNHPTQYVALWLATGILSAALILTQMFTRATRLHSLLAPQLIRAAISQFLPAAAAGLITPMVILHSAPGSAWLIPALWQILFSLGVFACSASLPRAMLLAGAWFFLTGFSTLYLGAAHAFSPVTMAGPYASGMAWVAFIYRCSTRHLTQRSIPDAR